MRMPRFTIGRLLWVVALVGVDLGACRALAVRNFVSNLETAIVLAPIIVALQLASWRAIRGPARSRPLWLGFATLGSICPLTFLLWRFSPERAARIPRVVYMIMRYLEVSSEWLCDRIESVLRPYDDLSWVDVVSLAVTVFLPQLLVAGAGGLLGHAVVGSSVRHLRGRCRAAVARGSTAYGRDPSPALSTNAEFFDPNPMQLHKASLAPSELRAALGT